MKKVLKPKGYAHLDYHKTPETVEAKIKDPKWISHHAFLPLIHMKMYLKKRQGSHKPFTFKEREIFYSCHTDSYIYQYYSSILVEKYEKYLKENDFSDAPTAYRSIDGKCNIHFAKEAFDFIKTQEDVYVFVTDLHSFFDSLNHKLLKKQVQKVLEMPSGLTDDWYTVYKSVTKATYFDFEEIASLKGKTKKDLRKEKINILLEPKLMRSSKKKYLQYYSNLVNSREKGIPQGTSISAAFANVYMIDFDKNLSKYVKSIGGFYRRYSDDIICVVPFYKREEFINFFEEQHKTISIEISTNKTKRFHVQNGNIIEILSLKDESNDRRKIIEYLGFSYDGKRVLLKDGTLNKFYKKLDSRLYLIKEIKKNTGKVVGIKRLYKRYTHLGESRRKEHVEKVLKNKNDYKYANFFTYVYKASNVMESKEIKHQLSKHWKHIQNFLRKI